MNIRSVRKYVRLWIKDFFYKVEPPITDNTIVLLNTEIGSDNLGDSIIMKHCKENLKFILSKYIFYEVASHMTVKQYEMKRLMKAKAVIVCGTNFLSTRMEQHSVWKYEEEMRFIPNVILMGVGIGQYGTFSPYTKLFLRDLLKNKFIHSVRDEYTLNKLKTIGIQNVINTSCVTLWGGVR